MKLGLSFACYRWELYPNLQRTSPEYIGAGYPELYFSSVPVALPLEEGGLEWLMDPCAELELSVLYAFSTRLQDHDYARNIRDRAERQGLELILQASFDWAPEVAEAEKERAKCVDSLMIAKNMGVRIVNVRHSDPLKKNHYTKNPSITTQIERMKENFAQLASIADEMSVIITMENHTDYRCSEIVQVLEAVNSPSLMANFDTGNPVNVIEDPVEAAKSIASYTVKVHLKDYRVMNYSMIDGTPKFSHAPTGQGDIDIPQILDILQRNSPDPDNLRLCLETVPPLDVDPGMWVRKCVSNIREMFAEYLT